VRDIGLLAIQGVYPTAKNLQDSNWVREAAARPDLVTKAYSLLQNHSFLHSLGINKKMLGVACSLLNDPSMYEKLVFRIDIPHETKEMAWWHQDNHYVEGLVNDITIWFPLFDTRIEQGPISVMPGSHQMGSIQHEQQFGKKRIPRGIYDREIRIMEINAGDALVFDGCLLHSSNVNFSHEIRYSVQMRYTQQKRVTENMGSLLRRESVVDA